MQAFVDLPKAPKTWALTSEKRKREREQKLIWSKKSVKEEFKISIL